MTYSFSEAATLYAQNLPVVNEMERAYKDDLKKFFEHVGQLVEKELAPTAISSVLDKASWYFWLGDEEWSDHRVAVWCVWDQPLILTESRVVFEVGTKALAPAEIERVAALGRSPSLEKWYRAKKASTWSVFRLETTWRAGEDPAEAAAAPIAAMLRLLD